MGASKIHLLSSVALILLEKSMKLYGVALSPFTRKAMFALEYYGFEYESEATLSG